MSAASGGCSEPERAGQRRRAMRAHMMREVSATRRNRKSSAAARMTSGRAEWFCKAKNLIHALLAQLVEQLTLNQRAQGSSPWKCTKRSEHRTMLAFLLLHFPPSGAASPFALRRSGSARRASQAKKHATGMFFLTPSSRSAPQRGGH